jgi:hypothetical protein
MKDTQPIIVGAGLAGLIAAHAWPRALVYETSPGPSAAHKALLRFRGEAVAALTGVEFERVLVRKGIWCNGAFRAPNIQLCNLYAQKILGDHGLAGSERSIWNIEPTERFIAPQDFYEQLVAAVGPRIQWGTPFNLVGVGQPTVSTMPLPAACDQLDITMPAQSFPRAPITVHRWSLDKVKLYQTIYFPALDVPIYRASITGSTLIVECAAGTSADRAVWHATQAFGIELLARANNHETVDQKFGKIIELPASIRRPLLHRLTSQHNVYSLGRFATYRNILLDDVVQDIAVIRRLMRADAYGHSLTAFNR